MLAALTIVVAASAHGQAVSRTQSPPAKLEPLASRATGRVQPQADGSLRRQWPGTYFEAAFTGTEAFFRVGSGDVSLRITVDAGTPITVSKPAPGMYRVSGLSAGDHRLRIDVASESQAGPTDFGGFFARPGTGRTPLARRPRSIEFIGDSHTVGYGNTSASPVCTQERIWATTNTSRGIAPLTAARYNADYQVNAISGRGVVRNYNGFAADTLPQAYPFALFDRRQLTRDPAWRPQVIVIALGTNDFTTPLNPGEKWTTRGALHADFESSYVRFVQRLRAANPRAYIVLWATDLAGGEIQAEVAKVADRLQQEGDVRIGYIPVAGLAMSACDHHPGLADDRKIADALIAHLDAHPEAWGEPRANAAAAIRD